MLHRRRRTRDRDTASNVRTGFSASGARLFWRA